MHPKKLLSLLILALNLCVFGQIEPKPAPQTDDAKKLETNAIELLKETGSDVNNLRSLPNRVGFSAELASLMWLHDERQAKQMYAGVITDFRELLARYDADLNAVTAEITPSTAQDPSDRMLAERRMRTAISVAQQIASSMADHDPELAFNFYFDSVAVISNPEFRKQVVTQNGYFETQLLTRIAQANPMKAVPYAKRSLMGGFNYQHMELLRNLYTKDPDAAIAFGEQIVDGIKSGTLDRNNLSAVTMLLSFGSQSILESKKTGGKRALFTDTQLREVSDALADVILDFPPREGPSVNDWIGQVEHYSPAKAMQIRARFGLKKLPPPPRMIETPTISTRNLDSAEAATVQTDAGGDNPQVRAASEQSKKSDQMMEDLNKLSNKELPAEERSKMIAQVRKIIAETPGREKRIGALCFLAAQVKLAGDKDLASSILKEAAAFVNPQPKNYQDFLLSWSLAAGYASVDADAAFALLEDTISRANDTIEAFVKVGEFIDITGEMVDDGEIQVGAIGGGNMIRNLTGELGMADPTLTLLARADFPKTRDLTNKFERPEVRVLAKMLVIRSILRGKMPGKPEIDKAISLEQ